MNKRWRSPSIVLACVVPLVALAFGWRTLCRYDDSPNRTDRIPGSTQLNGTPDLTTLFNGLDTRWTPIDRTGTEMPTPSRFFDARPNTKRFKPRPHLRMR